MNIHTGEIQLVPYKEEYKEVIETFTLPSEQVQFTSDPAELLKKAKNDRTKNVIVILDYNGVPVGLLHCKQEIEYRNSQKMRTLYF